MMKGVVPSPVAVVSAASAAVSTPNTATDPNLKKYQGVEAQVLKYMGANCSQSEAAKAAGCDTSYVSQLWEQADFRTQVEALRSTNLERKLKVDDAYEETEAILADRLRKSAALLTNTDQILRVLKFTNEAKKKLAPQAKQEGDGGTVVNLQIPVFLQQQFRVNPNNEVVEVNGRVLQTMDTKGLERLVKRIAETPMDVGNVPEL
jgi:hypothetical protein